MKLIERIALYKFVHTKFKSKGKAQCNELIERIALNKFVPTKYKNKRKAQCT